jgi:hypothetical protein
MNAQPLLQRAAGVLSLMLRKSVQNGSSTSKQTIDERQNSANTPRTVKCPNPSF